MSIAMTVVVAPSRCLRLVLAGFGASLFAAAVAVGLLAPWRFTGGLIVAAALLFAGLCLLHTACRAPVMNRIDISGLGRIRLAVQQDVGMEADSGVPMTLLPGSTLWPRLMLLRLGAANDPADGACRYVVVLPDSVAPGAFRALAVALGGIAGQVAGSSIQHKIL
ncbi:hypothetical protein [Telluria aromaticivorans]|uniref:Flagellar hook-length control protein n=1 Tax=Telluria aromaticivorans TaxID=2725995 RepID=A0A7Y2NYI2_9BURK|nr:hypothetical protein [Telluria aromaticivorans]NNG22029.1 hypothetical protein [Telluria aromaticivorans]